MVEVLTHHVYLFRRMGFASDLTVEIRGLAMRMKFDPLVSMRSALFLFIPCY
jgi:hypothetical protein